MKQLPIFNGYTVDMRLREFRKIKRQTAPDIEIIPFDSEKGEQLLSRLIEILSTSSPLFKEVKNILQ